jgi:hypothetical protein
MRSIGAVAVYSGNLMRLKFKLCACHWMIRIRYRAARPVVQLQGEIELGVSGEPLAGDRHNLPLGCRKGTVARLWYGCAWGTINEIIVRTGGYSFLSRHAW